MKKIIVMFLLGLAFVSLGLGSVHAGEEVNLYTNRHYDTDKEILNEFTKETGIEVNVLKGDSDQLIERMAREGESTSADLLITADAGRLHRAKKRGLLQPITTPVLKNNVPENLKDKENYWYGLTMRARVIVYSKERVNHEELNSYKDLTSSKWKDEILVRSSSNIYNQSLLASFIAIHGEEWAEDWAAGIVDNMARRPKGNDRAQATAVASGEGDIAIMNTYYLGKMINSDNPAEVEVAKNIAIHFPSQDKEGTHINVSGIGMIKYAPNKENAIKLMEYLSSKSAQKSFASANYEYPVNPEVEPSKLLKSWGEFNLQDINLTNLGIYNDKAVKIFNKVGWR